MNVTVVIERELRGESRRPANYWLRVLSGGAFIALFAGFVLTTQLSAGPFLGRMLFLKLHRISTIACWVFVPLMTADCVSRERREGTLGLLFLTPLTPLDVILGKGAAHILRVVTLFLAALPVLGLPLVLGGVNALMVLDVLGREAGAVLLGIAAGIAASIRGGSTVQVMVRAGGYGVVLAATLWVAHSLFEFLFKVLSWPLLRMKWGPFLFLGARTAFDVWLFWRFLRSSAQRLQRTWQEEARTAEQPPWVKFFSTSDFWRTAFRWDKSRTLDRNPMAWLQEYSWTARLTKWGWFLVLLLIELILLTNWDDRKFSGCQPTAAALLTAGIAFSAANSFRRERQEGLLELLLVTPLSTRQVLGGRVWGICCHYLPAIAVLVVGWIGDRSLNARLYGSNSWDWLVSNPLAFGSLVTVGLFLSLGSLNFLLAWVATWLLAFLLPALASGMAFGYGYRSPQTIFALVSAYQVALSLGFWFLLHRNLRLRTFLRAETT